jgi:hypothetical protein
MHYAILCNVADGHVAFCGNCLTSTGKEPLLKMRASAYSKLTKKRANEALGSSVADSTLDEELESPLCGGGVK